jgi:pimeloyl-ACP methyl ester carboxylesterase
MVNAENSPAFIAASEGFDVWLANGRGNTHSRKHIYLNPDTDEQFWDFSWEKAGRLDIPAVADYIIAETGFEKVSYIGHS